MKLVDTHAHLYFEQYRNDLTQVLLNARQAGLEALINIGIDLDTSKMCAEMAETHSIMYAAAGIHPHDVASIKENDLEEIAALLEHPKVVAIGEVGLDFYRDISAPEDQRKIFKIFLDWSLEYEMPLIIHTREAEEDILKLISSRKKKGWRGVFHCFPGDEEMAKAVLDLGFYISFTGNITFKKSSSYRVMKSVPLERLLIETDSPFLTPVPFRGKRNEPAYVQYVAQSIANAKGVSVESVAERTTLNAMNLFGLSL
jgi:TatD DNase family protein